MGKIKNIIFDFGGVLITIDQPQAVKRFQQIGLTDADKRLDSYTQSGIFGELESGKINAEQFRQKLSDVIGKDLTSEECAFAWQGYCGELPQRNLDTLLMLKKQGYRLILMSNNNPFVMGWALSESFDGNGHPIDYYFDALYISYQHGLMKPDQAFFRKVLEIEDIQPEETLFIDDGFQNIAAAKNLRIQTFCPENGADWTKEIYFHLNQKQ